MEKKNNSISFEFGVMCNSRNLQQWQYDCIKILTSHGHRLNLVIYNDSHAPSRTALKKLLGLFQKDALYRLYDRFFHKLHAKREKDASALFKDADGISVQVIRKSFSEFFPQDKTDQISSYKLDFILRFGFNIIRGNILKSARFGVWSFHHGDELKYRGGPPAFWEIFNREKQIGSVLQQLTDKLDAGIILYKGYLPVVNHSWKESLDQLLRISSKWPLRICNELALQPNAIREKKSSTTQAKIYKKPGNIYLVLFLVKLLRNKIFFHWWDLFRAEKWNIATLPRPVTHYLENDIETEELSWLPVPDKSCFRADPFGISIEGEDIIFFEEYNYKNDKGEIKKFQGKCFMDSGIESSGHLSFPYLFIDGADLFCLPEAAQNNALPLYKFARDKKLFEKCNILIKDQAIVDPVLFFFKDCYYLFCTLKEYSNVELHIFYSHNLTGDYIPHSLNPVKTDICSARPAGNMFWYKENLYRPSQNSAEAYGRKIILNRVLELSPKRYREEKVKMIEIPQTAKYNKGIHTLSIMGDKTLIDAKKYVFNYSHFIRKVKNKLS